MRRVLITGGLGFIGVHCIKKWHSEGWIVDVIDNLSSNTLAADDPAINGMVDKFFIGDLTDKEWYELPNYDLVVHLASPVGPVGILKYTGIISEKIIGDTYWVIEVARKNNCPLIFVSTSEIYGHRDAKSYLKEFSEKVLVGDYTVRNEYSVAKMLSEIILTNIGKVDGSFKYQLIRPFNVTGEHQLPNGGFVLPRFVDQALRGNDITVYGDGNQIRAFTWVRDVVEGIYLTSIADECYFNQEWNIGNEANETTINYLAEMVKERTDSSSAITHVDPKTLHGKLFEEAPEKIPCSDKIRRLLGWKPVKGIIEIIDEVIEYGQSRIK